MRTITLSGCVWLLVMLNYTSLLNYGLFPSFISTHPPVKRFDPDAAKTRLGTVSDRCGEWERVGILPARQ